MCRWAAPSIPICNSKSCNTASTRMSNSAQSFVLSWAKKQVGKHPIKRLSVDQCPLLLVRAMRKRFDAMRDFIATTVYYIISILLFPVSLLGYVIWVGKGFLTGNPSGVSATAQGPLSARWAMHNLGTRHDEPANRLMPLLPGVPPLASRMASFPTLPAHRVSGYVPKAFRYPFEGDVPPLYEASARVTFFDEAVDRSLAEIDQFVILGAGFDTRPYRLPKGTRVRSFEVDAPKTQAVKREMLAKAGIDSSKVTFVAADFEKDDWLARLVDSGFDAA